MPAAASPLATTIHLLHRASQRADALFIQHVSDRNVTPRQFAVLEAVAGNDGLSQTDIIDATGIDRSSTAELVRRLVRGRFLQRRRTRRDARAYSVKITPAGRKLLTSCAPAVRSAHEQLLDRFSAIEREAFHTLLARIAIEQPSRR